LNPGKSQ
jgi:chromosome segregation ATPase